MVSSQFPNNTQVEENNGFPLTPLQRSMHAGANLTGQPWLYVEQIVVDVLDGRLDAEAMGRAWSDLVRCHPALRNTITTDEQGVWHQQTQPVGLVVPDVLDWSGLTPELSAQRLSEFLIADRAKGVDAACFPAFRITFIATADNTSKLVWTFPHSLLDGRSFALLLDDVFKRYGRSLSGDVETSPPSVAPDLFTAHCRKLATISHTEGVDFFAEMLAGWGGATSLVATDREATRKRFSVHQLTAEQSQALVKLAKRSDTALSSVILAAWGVVAARFTGQQDVVFGNTRNGRHLVPGSAEAAGCFITTVPVRIQLQAGLTVGELLTRIREDQIASRPYEHTPLTEIRKRLHLPPHSNFIESVVMFDYGTLDEQMKARGREWARRKVTLLEEGDTPVTIAAYMGEQLQIDVEFDPEQILEGQRLADCLIQFLGNLAMAEPDTLLATVSMLPFEEAAQLYDLAGPVFDVPDLPSSLDGFEQTAKKFPDKPALIQPGQKTVTYGTLDARASGLAAGLSRAGVQPGDVVGICMARGADFVAAILAVWKAGAAFVPMDPSYPVDTLNIIAEDSKARLVLVGNIHPELSARQEMFETLLHAVSGDTQLNSQSISTDQTAYIIFTSGSTGRPKGVMISHQSLAAHGKAVTHLFELTPEDRVLQFAALSFDVALEEIIPTLVVGATLVLRSDEMSLSVGEFLKECNRLKITVMNLPTGFWAVLVDELGSHMGGFPDEVRLVIVGGERIPPQALKRWREHLPELRWLNGYGPTETTITCTVYEAPPGPYDSETVPIGRSLGHARAWILSKDGALAPLGAEGELFISGPAVAKGYIGNPERMAQSFGIAAFDADVGRIYATGDRAVWHNGQLHFLGRQDRQIKLRGFRIEPGQIEEALESHAQVGRAYAALFTPVGGQPQLVAWYSAAAGQPSPEVAKVRQWVAQFLPSHMRPDLVEVTDWPQTPGGKVDTVKLPAPATAKFLDAGDSDTAATPLTDEIATIFSGLLGISDIGPETSFFDAGGDSLALLRLLPLLEDRFKVTIKPTALYSDPTPRGVARALQAQDPDPLVVIPIQEGGNLPPLYGVHVLGDNGSFYRPMAAELGEDQPVYGLTVGLLTETTPTQVSEIARFYLCQIERHYPEGPLSLIAVSAGSYVTLELAQQLLQAGRDVQALILLDAEGPGGRPTVGRGGRLAAHARLIAREGWTYVAKRIAARREAAMLAVAMSKLETGDQAVEADVTNFVAANTLAIKAYEPQPYARRLTIYRAASNLFDSREAIDTGLGWQSVASAGFDILDVPGDHLGILEPPNVSVLASRIAKLLRAQQKITPTSTKTSQT